MFFANLQEYLHPTHFDRSNYLTPEGLTIFWKAIDHILEDFDHHKEKLIPRPVISEFTKRQQAKREPNFGLPHPPPAP